MLILKRLVVWFLEMSCITVLLTVAWVALSATSQQHVVAFLRSTLVGVLIFMLAFGFPISTAIVSVLWRGRRLWSYPMVATLLFLGHIVFAHYVGGTPPSGRLTVVGMGIVFVCTLLGSVLLRKWSQGEGGALP